MFHSVYTSSLTGLLEAINTDHTNSKLYVGIVIINLHDKSFIFVYFHYFMDKKFICVLMIATCSCCLVKLLVYFHFFKSSIYVSRLIQRFD